MAVGPWLRGWSGAKGRAISRPAMAAGAEECVGAAKGREWVGGGSRDSFQDLTWQPFPAGRA